MVIDVETPFPPPVSGVISRVASSRQWGGVFPPARSSILGLQTGHHRVGVLEAGRGSVCRIFPAS